MTKFIELIAPALTIENAKIWAAETDKYLFAYNLIEATTGRPACEPFVNYVEEKFEELLAA